MPRIYSPYGTVTYKRVASPSGSNALADAFANLAAGQGVVFAAPTLTNAIMTNSFLGHISRWHWHPDSLKGYMVCGAGGSDIRLVQYDAATDTFSLLYNGTPAVGGGGTAQYGADASTIDPATGEIYYLPGNGEYIIKWDGSTWVQVSGNVTGVGDGTESSTPRGITWHQSVNSPSDAGIVIGRGSAFRYWKKSSGLTIPEANIAGPSVCRYSTGVYLPNYDFVLQTFGTGGQYYNVVMPDVAVSSAGSFPLPVSGVSASTDANLGHRLALTPASAAIFETANPGRIWKYFPETDTFELQAATHSMMGGTYHNWAVMYCSTYGGYMVLRRMGATSAVPQVYLYKLPNASIPI